MNGERRFKEEYVYEAEDTAVRNGNYLGVSWWSREVEVPREFKGKSVTLFIRGARLRAEVFWNRRLVGYNIINETSFTCDVSEAVQPGKTNELAIRITNPGGRLDWVDTELLTWGKTAFQKSHGFGGLDRGLRLIPHDPVRSPTSGYGISRSSTGSRACATLTNGTGKPVDATLSFEVLDPSGSPSALGSSSKRVRLAPHASLDVSSDLTCASVAALVARHPPPLCASRHAGPVRPEAAGRYPRANLRLPLVHRLRHRARTPSSG